MKTLKIYLKPIACLLTFLILFQGCTVYKSASVTLEEAVKKQKKVQITTLDNRTMSFKQIVFRDGKYFGVKKLKDNATDVCLFEKDIEYLKIKNETLSTILSIGLPVFLLIATVAVFLSADQSFLNFESDGN